MKRIASLLLLSPLAAFAFGGGSDVTWWRILSSPQITPATLGAAGWWEPSRGLSYATNSGLGTLSNLTAIGAAWNLTNSTSTQLPIRQAAMLNGLDTLYFNNTNGCMLTSEIYTSTQPHHVFIVLSLTNTSQSDTYYLGAKAAPTQRLGYNHSGDLKFSMAAGVGGVQVSTTSVTNRYFVLDAYFSNTLSVIRTNGVPGINANAGTNWGNGLQLAGDQGANKAQMSFACMFTFTNKTLTPAEWLMGFQYCTSRWAIATP